jgi:hypothetical protein
MVPGTLEALYRAQESYGARSVSGFADATGEQGVGMTSWLRLTIRHNIRDCCCGLDWVAIGVYRCGWERNLSENPATVFI